MKISVPSRMWQPGARRDRTQMLTYCFCFRLEPADETRRTDSGISAAEKRRRRRCGGNRRSGGCDRNPGTACSDGAVHASGVSRAALVGAADRFCIGSSDRHAVRRPAVLGRCDPVRWHRFERATGFGKRRLPALPAPSLPSRSEQGNDDVVRSLRRSAQPRSRNAVSFGKDPQRVEARPCRRRGAEETL